VICDLPTPKPRTRLFRTLRRFFVDSEPAEVLSSILSTFFGEPVLFYEYIAQDCFFCFANLFFSGLYFVPSGGAIGGFPLLFGHGISFSFLFHFVILDELFSFLHPSFLPVVF